MGRQGKGVITSNLEGDHLFLERLLSGNPTFFSLKVEYEGERLAKWKFFS